MEWLINSTVLVLCFFYLAWMLFIMRKFWHAKSVIATLIYLAALLFGLWAGAATFGHLYKAHSQEAPKTLHIRQVDGKVVTYDILLMKDPIPFGPKLKCEADAITYCDLLLIEFYEKAEPAVLVHEAMHAITMCSSRSLETHEFIYNLEKPVSDLFIDNPKLLDFLHTGKANAKLTKFSEVPKDCK